MYYYDTYIYILTLKNVFLMLYLFLRERERESASERLGEKQREGETQNWKQIPGSELSAQNPTWGWNPRAVRSRHEPKCSTD